MGKEGVLHIHDGTLLNREREIMPVAATRMQVVLVVKTLPVNAGDAERQVCSLGGGDALE